MQLPDDDHGTIQGVTADPAHLPPTEIHRDVVDPNRGHLRPSGYWTGYRPANGGAYKWSLMGIGAVVTLVTAMILIITLRRVSRQRPARPGLRPTS